MSRRTLPPIAPSDLRDHADDERIGRIWDRLEHSLAEAPVTEASPRPKRLTVLLVAASFAAFGGGVLVGKVVSRHGSTPVAVSSSTVDQPSSDVLAAGSQTRTFALPGGGEISLLPGATVEIVRDVDGNALTLRLVQGEATIDAGPRTTGLALSAGDARVASSAGSMLRVSRGSNHLNLDVKMGSASLVAADGSKKDLFAGEGVEGVPLHSVTSAVTPPNSPKRDRVAVAPSTNPVASGQPDVPVAAVAAAAPEYWRELVSKGRDVDAVKILAEQPGGIRGAILSAKSATELFDLADALKKTGNTPSAVEAYERVLASFPSQKTLAATYLANIYKGRAEKGEQGADEKYRRYLALSNAKDSPIAADQACKLLQEAARASRKEEATAAAQDYVNRYPHGVCRDDADRVLRGESLGTDEPEPKSSGDKPADKPADKPSDKPADKPTEKKDGAPKAP